MFQMYVFSLSYCGEARVLPRPPKTFIKHFLSPNATRITQLKPQRRGEKDNSAGRGKNAKIYLIVMQHRLCFLRDKQE